MKRDLRSSIIDGHFCQVNQRAFTLSELLVTVLLVGILSSAALPNFFRQLQKTKQAEAANILTFLSTSVMGYMDEFGRAPTTWEELSEISTVMTPSGPVTSASGKLSCEITIQSGNYTIYRTNGKTTFTKCSAITSDIFIFEAVPTSTNQTAASFNAISCVDSELGISDLKLGNKNASGAVDKTHLIKACQ